MVKKNETFSVTKAVKANARTQVGQPKSEIVLPDEKQKAQKRSQKHKESLSELLERSKREG